MSNNLPEIERMYGRSANPHPPAVMIIPVADYEAEVEGLQAERTYARAVASDLRVKVDELRQQLALAQMDAADWKLRRDNSYESAMALARQMAKGRDERFEQLKKAEAERDALQRVANAAAATNALNRQTRDARYTRAILERDEARRCYQLLRSDHTEARNVIRILSNYIESHVEGAQVVRASGLVIT